MKKPIALLLVVTALSALLCSCGLAAKVERGTTDANTYTNEALGITFTKPDGWTFYSESQIAQLMNISADLMKDPELLNKSDITSVIDFMAINPANQNNVNLSIENLAASGNTTMSVNAYIDAFKKLLSEQFTAADYTFSDNEKVTLGGNTYTRVTATLPYQNVSMTQYLYIRKVGSHMITVTATANTNEKPETFEAMFS